MHLRRILGRWQRVDGKWIENEEWKARYGSKQMDRYPILEKQLGRIAESLEKLANSPKATFFDDKLSDEIYNSLAQRDMLAKVNTPANDLTNWRAISIDTNKKLAQAYEELSQLRRTSNDIRLAGMKAVQDLFGRLHRDAASTSVITAEEWNKTWEAVNQLISLNRPEFEEFTDESIQQS